MQLFTLQFFYAVRLLQLLNSVGVDGWLRQE
jgi:hypothetical protein